MKFENPKTHELIQKLKNISRMGYIESSFFGSNAVGMQLLNLLGISHKTTQKPRYHGILVTSRRRRKTSKNKFFSNKVNLFAQVADWKKSQIKSSKEMLEKYGKIQPNATQKTLNNTTSSNYINTHGLKFEIDIQNGLLNEVFIKNQQSVPCITWEMSVLHERLLETQDSTIWVSAEVIKTNGKESFHYRDALVTIKPNLMTFNLMIQNGVITMDHLISTRGEKGPLFKIPPKNLQDLFEHYQVIDLLS